MSDVEQRLAELERQVERVARAVAEFAASRRIEVTGVRFELHVGHGRRTDERGDLRAVDELDED